MFVFRSVFAAIGFLTIWPVPRNWQGENEELRASAWFFPWVGLGIGAAAAYFDIAAGFAFENELVRSACTVVFLIAASKALHLDGLADTADGFLSSKPKDRILEIMKDSRIGAMGVFALGSLILLKVVALAAIASPSRFEALCLAPVVGRTVLLLQMGSLPYARPEGGLATVFVERGTPFLFVYGLVCMGAAGFVFLGFVGLLVTGTVAFFIIVFSFYCRRKIGGLTGDTLGASCEMAELGTLMAVVALWGRIPC